MHTQQEGLTPLMLASQEGHVDVASTLIHHGADVNCQDEVSYTLFITCTRRHFLISALYSMYTSVIGFQTKW